MNNSLCNIEKDYLEIVNELEENEGEVTPELDERLKINKADFDKKMDAYSDIITTVDIQNTAIDAEIKRLQNLKQSRIKVVENLKSRMVDAIKLYGFMGKSNNALFQTDRHRFFTVLTHKVGIDDWAWDSYKESFENYLKGKDDYLEPVNNLKQDMINVEIKIRDYADNALNTTYILNTENIPYDLEITPNKTNIKTYDELPDMFENQTYSTIRIR
jgi:hypothetical protein